MTIVPYRYSERKIFCFVCMKQKLRQCRDETTGTISENCHFHCDSQAIVFHWIGDTSFKCQSEHGTHSYGCITRGIARAQLSLCALRTQSLRTNNSSAVSKQSKGSCLLSSPFIWKLRWDSLRRGPLKLPLSGLGRPRPGRCAPSAWLNRLRDTAVTTSTSPILREL